MKRRTVLLAMLGLVALAAAVGGAWLASLPGGAARPGAPPIAQEEADAMIAALRPPRRRRPLIAVVGINDATETTDYLMPLGILRRADVADVVALATGPGPVTLYPALRVQPDATIAAFDAQHPEGADYVVVPAMSRDDDPAAIDWIRRQAAKGAIVVGVCAGAKVVAAAGLLDGKRGTTHWYYLDEMLGRHPTIRYVADRRMVVDGKVATTTGVTASMPAVLTLVEAIAGREKAQAAAGLIGIDHWDVRHNSRAFRLTRPFALAVIGNRAAFWRHERLGLERAPEMDEVTLALVADAWSRTYRSRAITFADAPRPVTTAGGIRILPDDLVSNWQGKALVPLAADQPPARALDRALREIERRYGAGTARLVAMQLEYPR